MKTIVSTILVVAAVALLGVGGYYGVNYLSAAPATSFKTTAVKRGDIMPTIAATGTLQPEEIVDVGAQVVGRIIDFGIDPSDPDKKKRIDYGSIVHENTDLAYIDDEKYRAAVDQAQASLKRAEADLLQYKAKLVQSQKELKRSKELISLGTLPGSSRPIKGIADSDFDLAVANEAVGHANVATAEASIKLAQAALHLAETDLKYTVIKSPVEGVIIVRRVNIGQTVVSSLNSPSLFLLAKDLTRMQVWASVNEADIGRIKLDMPVSFTVDAFPQEVFKGKVVQIRDNATMTQNVVTYTVVVSTDNANRRLRPFLTANLQFEIDQRKDVLTVTNAALRWKPKPTQIDPEFRVANAGEKQAGKPLRGSGTGETKPNKPLRAKSDRGKVWVEDGEFVRPVNVQIGLSDGITTEISGDELKEGMEVVIGTARKDAAAEETTNPFAPKIFGPKH